eukprot:476918-Pelagomonas_calceolata.AAC.4
MTLDNVKVCMSLKNTPRLHKYATHVADGNQAAHSGLFEPMCCSEGHEGRQQQSIRRADIPDRILSKHMYMLHRQGIQEACGPYPVSILLDAIQHELTVH